MSEMQLSDAVRTHARDKQRCEPWLELVREALGGLQYGSVVITVQDGIVVQVDRTEKHRLQRPPTPGASRSNPRNR